MLQPSILHRDVLEENKAIEIEAEGDIEVVSAQGTEVKRKVTTEAPVKKKDVYEQVSRLAGEESIGEGSHKGCEEKMEEEHEGETETEGDAVEEEIGMKVKYG